MLTDYQKDKIREQEERAYEEALVRASVRDSLPKPPRRSRVRATLTGSTFLKGLYATIFAIVLAAAIPYWVQFFQDRRDADRRHTELKTEMQARLVHLSDQIGEDRRQLQFGYPAKREATLRKQFYNDMLTFLEKSPATAEGIASSYPQFNQLSFLTLSRELADFDSQHYANVPSTLRRWDASVFALLNPQPNLFDTPEERAQSYAPLLWANVFKDLPTEWKEILRPTFQPKIIEIYD